MSRLPYGNVKALLCASLLVLLTVTGASAQSLISQANPAMAGQQTSYVVVGNTAPVCLVLAQVDTAGNLLTLSTYYIGALATYTLSGPSLGGTSTTAIFAISEPNGTNAGTACQAIPSSFLGDLARAPRIFETVTSGGQTTQQIDRCIPALKTERLLKPLGLINFPQSSSTTPVQYEFELLPFQPASGNLFASLLTNCSNTYVNQGGASGIITCSYPTTGGSFSNQSY